MAVDQGAVIGAVLGVHDGRRGWIYHLAVQPEAQGRGLRTALLAQVEARLRHKGCRKVNLLIDPANAPVQGFYERLQYRRDDLLFMEKWLS